MARPDQAPLGGSVSRDISGLGQASGRPLGYIDRVDRYVVHGWCCDAGDMERSMHVEAVSSSGKRCVVIASIYRRDVEEAGFGHGRYGFVIDLAPLASKDDKVVLRFLDSKVPIGSEPICFDPQNAVLSHSFPDSFLVVMRQLADELYAKHAEMADGFVIPERQSRKQ